MMLNEGWWCMAIHDAYCIILRCSFDHTSALIYFGEGNSVPIDTGTLLNTGLVHDAIKALCAEIGLGNAMVRLLREFTDGFSETRVVLGEVSQTPNDPRPLNLVFKVGPGRLLRDEVTRYLRLKPRAGALAAFASLREAKRMMGLLPNSNTIAAICYEHAAAMLGATECIPLRDLFRDGVTANQPMDRVEAVIDSLGNVLMSLYGNPETNCYAWEAAKYYFEHWTPDFKVSVDRVARSGDRPLLTLQRLNPAHFDHEPATSTAMLRTAAESPPLSACEIVLPRCIIAEAHDEKLVAYAPAADDLSLEIDLRLLSLDDRRDFEKGNTIAVWAPAKSSRYSFYSERIQSAIEPLNTSAATFDAGPLWTHQPLMHLSRALRGSMGASQSTWKVPSHGDLHGGNILVVGSVPVIIDYGKGEESLPVGVDAARLVGTLIRDVLSTLLSPLELVAVLAESLELGHFVDDGDTRAARALRLINRLSDKLLPPGAPNARSLWPAHLYGFAWIGLKWPGSENAYRASYLLAAVTLNRMLGSPSKPRTNSSISTGQFQPIRPEGAAEILVLVSRFAGSADYDPTTRIYSALCDHLLEVAPGLARVEQIEEVISSRTEAMALASEYRASMIVWGTYDNFGIRPRYEVTRDSLLVKRSTIQLDEATRYELADRFEPYITKDLAAEISFLSLVAVGDMCILNLNYGAAIRVYRRAVELIANQARARELGMARLYYNLAAMYGTIGIHSEAMVANGKLLALHPADLLGEIQRAVINARVNKKKATEALDELRESLRQRIESNKVSESERKALHNVLDKVAPLKSAQELLRLVNATKQFSYWDLDAKGKYRKDVVVNLRRAMHALQHWKFEPCLSAIRQALRINPKCLPALVMRAVILSEYGRMDEALKDLEKASKIVQHGAINCARAVVLYEKGAHAEVVHEFEIGFARGGPKGLFLKYWGFSMVDVGRGDEVIQYIRNAEVGVSLASPTVFIVRSYYYRSQKQNDLALREVEQALSLSKDSEHLSEALFERAEVYQAMGMTELALKDYDRICSLVPKKISIARRALIRIAVLRKGVI